MLGNLVFMFLLSSADIFKMIFFKTSFRNTIRVSDGLDPEDSVSPDLAPNCLQSLSADDKGHRQQEKY